MPRKWTYKTSSPIFQKLFREAAAAVEVILNWEEEPFVTDSPYVSPYYGDVSKLKKVTMFLGERDMAYVMGLKTDEKMRKAGVDVHTIIGKGMNHVWPVQPVPEAIKAKKQIAEIIAR